MRCPWCGNRNPASATACASCGKDLVSARSTEDAIRQLDALGIDDPEIVCRDCGAHNSAAATFCSMCGASFEKPRETEIPPVDPHRMSLDIDLPMAPDIPPPEPDMTARAGRFLSKIAGAAVGLVLCGCMLAAVALPGYDSREAHRLAQRQRAEWIAHNDTVGAKADARYPSMIVVPVPLDARKRTAAATADGYRVIYTAEYEVLADPSVVRDYYGLGAMHWMWHYQGWELIEDHDSYWVLQHPGTGDRFKISLISYRAGGNTYIDFRLDLPKEASVRYENLRKSGF